MRKLPDWEARLAAYLLPLRLREFGPWGTYDCCIFGAGGVEAQTGVDPIPEFRGRYSTELGSVRALRRYGAGTLAATLDTKFAPVAHSLAQRGDLVMTSGLLTICWGAFAFAVGAEGTHEGLIRIERATWVDPLAWRVGS